MSTYKVVLTVKVENLDGEDEAEFHQDPLAFLQDAMLLDDAEVDDVLVID